MKPLSDLDAIRRHSIVASLAGFPFLLVMGLAWIAGGALSYWVPSNLAPWIYPCMGGIMMPVAIFLEPRLGYVPAVKPDPLLPLTLQLLFVQVVAFPAILLVWDSDPNLTPVAFAAVVGSHFIPFHWVYQTSVYTFLGIAVAVGPFIIALALGASVLHYTGFYVGVVMLIGAFLVRSHAMATWRAMLQDAQKESG